jgi:hypothetical protein
VYGNFFLREGENRFNYVEKRLNRKGREEHEGGWLPRSGQEAAPTGTMGARGLRKETSRRFLGEI